LHADAAAVDDPDEPETQAASLRQIFLDHRFYISGCNGVEVQNILNRDANRVVTEVFIFQNVLPFLDGTP
jgi:hypothetical protein